MKVGIDLGTTYSSLAFVDSGRCLHVPDATFGRLHHTPSVVKIRDSQSLVGRLAWRDEGPGDLFKDFKLSLGTPTQNNHARDGERWPSEVLSSLVLRKLRHDLRQHRRGEDIESVVLTHPLNFHDRQRRALLQVARLADLRSVTLIEEPVAAALHYMLSDPDVREGARILVYDWGGGTFDVAMVTVDPGSRHIRVHAKRGLSRCGGRDIDAIVRRLIEAEYQRQHGTALSLTRAGVHRLEALIEETIKLELVAPNAPAAVPAQFSIDGIVGLANLRRSTFDQEVGQLVDQTIQTCRDCLAEASMSPSDIDVVILVGGTSQVPQVKSRLERLFGTGKVKFRAPLSAVVHGAAARANEEAEVIQQDVCAHNLGLLVEDRRTASVEIVPLIPRGTIVGQMMRRTVTAPPGRELTLHLVEFGDDRRNWRLVDYFSVSTAALPDHSRDVVIEVKYDGNGCVQVSVRDGQTNREIGTVRRASFEDANVEDSLSERDLQDWYDRLSRYPINGVLLGRSA